MPPASEEDLHARNNESILQIFSLFLFFPAFSEIKSENFSGIFRHILTDVEQVNVVKNFFFLLLMMMPMRHNLLRCKILYKLLPTT